MINLFNPSKTRQRELEALEAQQKLAIDQKMLEYRRSLLDQQSRLQVDSNTKLREIEAVFNTARLKSVEEMAKLNADKAGVEVQLAAARRLLSDLEVQAATRRTFITQDRDPIVEGLNKVIAIQATELDKKDALLKEMITKLANTQVVLTPYKSSKG
jgi:uncharacterized coiled-coil protein SlyX